MSTDSPPATPDPRGRELTNAIIRVWLPWDVLAVLAIVGFFTLPERWTWTCIAAIPAVATIALQLGLRRIESSGLDREYTAPARMLLWSLVGGMYMFAVSIGLIWWSA